MRKLGTFIYTWVKFIVKGTALLPSYFRYWGFLTACKRIVRATILPGLNATIIEFVSFMKLKQDRLKVARIPDYIVSAPDFVGNSAGIACLYQLAYDLKKMGFETAMTGTQKGHHKFTLPLLSSEEASRFAKQGSWVIYPEIVNGNPLGAKNVLRWVLNRPGLLGGQTVYDSSEHIFVYSDVFAPYVNNTIRGKLYMPTLDRTLFFPPEEPNQPRGMTCYYVGKSTYKPGHLDPLQAFEITRNTPPRSELGKLFRASKVLYCFDNSTALIYEALLCGCQVIIIPDGTQTWEDYKTLELGVEGISWGKTDGLASEFTPTALQERLNKWQREYTEQLKYLAQYTQNIHALKQVKPAEFTHCERENLENLPPQIQ